MAKTVEQRETLQASGEKLFEWIAYQLLVADEYPNKPEVLKKLPELKTLMARLAQHSKRSAEHDLQLMGYTPALAAETAINVVGKVTAFFGLMLLRRHVENWWPSNAQHLSLDEQAVLVQAVLGQLDAFVQLANVAYYFDEDVDQPMDQKVVAEMGGYGSSTLRALIEEVETYLSYLGEIKAEERQQEAFYDIFKDKLTMMVDIYCNHFPGSWNELQVHSEFLNSLKEAGCLGLLPIVKFLATVGTAYKNANGYISTEGQRVLLDAVLPLADVMNYELMSKIAYLQLLQGRPNQQLPLPSDFKAAVSLRDDARHNSIFYGGAEDVFNMSGINSQGLFMVANNQYLMRRLENCLDENGQPSYQLNTRVSFREVRELINPNQGRQLRNYITLAQALVRLSDDIGDIDSDYAKYAPNLLLTPQSVRDKFLSYCEGLDLYAESKTNIKTLVQELFAYFPEHAFGSRNGVLRNKGLKRDGDYWVKRLLGELVSARAGLVSPEQGSDRNVHAHDYQAFVTDITEIAHGAIVVGTLANDELFSKAMKLSLH